jgi:hypothetical protein
MLKPHGTNQVLRIKITISTQIQAVNLDNIIAMTSVPGLGIGIRCLAQTFHQEDAKEKL